MLSLVVSDVPGLYVRDKIEKQWLDAEGNGQRAQATLLAGRELMRKLYTLKTTSIIAVSNPLSAR
jgi:hypothetical protein